MKTSSYIFGALFLLLVNTITAEPQTNTPVTSPYPVFEQEEDSYARGIKNAILILRKSESPFDYLGYVVKPNIETDFFKPVQAYADGVLYRIAGELVFMMKREGFPFRRDLLFTSRYAYQLVHIKTDRNLYDQPIKIYAFQPLMIDQ